MSISTNWASCNSKDRRLVRTFAMMRLQESRTVETSLYGLTRGVGLTPHSYSTKQYRSCFLTPLLFCSTVHQCGFIRIGPAMQTPARAQEVGAGSQVSGDRPLEC